MKYEEFLESMKGVATQLSQLHLQMAQQQEPVVEQLILSQSRDQQAIEQTLDRLLDVACCDAGLRLFRRLSRYYWTINPEATVGYVNAYREMWDSEDSDSLSGGRQGVSGQSVSDDHDPAPAASALPLTAERADPIRLFLTWTTYGTWLPGDNRGWRKEKKGTQRPQPRLEDWCRDQMKDAPVVLTVTQRNEVENIIREHCEIR